MSRRGSAAAVLSLACGVVGLGLAPLPVFSFAAALLGPVAIVSGVVGLVRGAGRVKTVALAGLLVGLAAVVLFLIWPLLPR